MESHAGCWAESKAKGPAAPGWGGPSLLEKGPGGRSPGSAQQSGGERSLAGRGSSRGWSPPSPTSQ